MPYFKYTLTSLGGTFSTYLDNSYIVETAAPVTLAASVSFVPSNPIPYSPIKIKWNADITLSGGFTVTIGGITVPQDQLNQPGEFELVYDGTGYTLQYYPDFTEKPQEAYGVTTIAVPVGGGTLTLNPGVDKKTYLLLNPSPTTLTSNYTVNGNTNPLQVKDGSSIRVVLGGGLTIGANTVTIFGQSISAYDCLVGGAEVFAEFNATTSSYVATYVNRDIPLDKLLTTGFVSGDNGKLVMYDHATKKFVKNFLSSINLPSTFKGINITQTNITSAQILALNTTPVTILPASGSATIVEVPLAFIVRYKWGSIAYTTNLTCRFENTGGLVLNPIAEKTNMLGFTASGFDIVVVNNYNATGHTSLLQENSIVRLRATGGNPAAGNSDITIYTISTTINI
jgi:hypothetical protein